MSPPRRFGADIAAARRRHPWAFGGGLVVAVLVIAVAVCEWWGWPFLAGPMQRALSDLLARPVSIAGAAERSDSADRSSGTRVHLLGGLSLTTERLDIGAPAWSKAERMLRVENGTVRLRYMDLWRARQGGPLRIKALEADRVEAVIERLADGRASWQFGDRSEPEKEEKSGLPGFDHLRVGQGVFAYRDAVLKTEVEGRLSLREGDASPAGETAPAGLQAQASGSYRGKPLRVELRSSGVLPWISEDTATQPQPLFIDARLAGSRLRFDGTATDLLRLAGLAGKAGLSGPSLSAVGDALGVTLPTTDAFRADGWVKKQGDVWNVRVDEAAIGSSRVNAALRYDGGRQVPLLAGRVGGSKLLLADLGPAIGTQPNAAGAAAQTRSDRVLPDRSFDLPSLRAMDANVLLDFGELDLGSSKLQPMQPLRAHLKLFGGVLEITDIVARTAEGQVRGMVSLDGTAAKAVWRTDLRWEGIQLDRWLSQSRPQGQPPYITGEVRGLAKLEGRGRSTAEILGDLDGQLRTELRGGTISHLLVEAAGLDVAEALARFLRGDKALSVNCGLADLQATKGVLRPRALVLDTVDSVLWVDGTISMTDETLDLRAVTTPKDFSPLTLRTPLRVRGSLGSPKISVEATPLLPKVGAAILLGLANPLAALLPLIDTGGSREDQGNAGCKQLLQRASNAGLKPGEQPPKR